MLSLGSPIKYLPTLARPMIIITGLSSIKIQLEGAVVDVPGSVVGQGGLGQGGDMELSLPVPLT